jgi:hypothetical protein
MFRGRRLRANNRQMAHDRRIGGSAVCRRRCTAHRPTVVGLSLSLAGALWFSGAAFASGGRYVFDGGTPYQQQQVQQALQVSSFNWNVIPGTITIHITPNFASESIPGEIFLDPGLLNSGEFAWGVVQHEYAHQVDFALFGDATRTALTAQLGGTAWCYGDAPGLRHSQYGCERFASTLAWAYWQSPENSMKPSEVANAESAAMAPAAFRALMASLLGTSAGGDPTATTSFAPRYALAGLTVTLTHAPTVTLTQAVKRALAKRR